MTNVRRALLIGVTVGVVVGAGAARIYYRGLPGALPAPLSSASVALDPLQAFKQRVDVELRDA
jgi:predicted lysophospholipase L1 biosynthesis ABC-type transport system permease subunit